MAKEGRVAMQGVAGKFAGNSGFGLQDSADGDSDMRNTGRSPFRSELKTESI
jgi:hypothetical protein